MNSSFLAGSAMTLALALSPASVATAEPDHGTITADQLKVAIQDLTTEPPDYPRQRRAAELLARAGAAAEPAMPALVKVLGQPLVPVGGDDMSPVPGFEDAIAAAERAVRAIGPGAAPALIAALPASAGGHAATLLADMSDSRAVKPLVAALGGPNEFQIQEALVRFQGAGVSDAVASRLDSKDARVRRVVVQILIGRRDMRALPAIVDVLAKGSAYQRWESVGDLANLRPPDVRERLHVLLEDADLGVRSEAASRLGDVGDGRDVPALIALLADKHAHMRWGAIRALGLLRDNRAIAPLEAALKVETDNGNRQAIEASIDQIKKA